jgi:hypothetical protein
MKMLEIFKGTGSAGKAGRKLGFDVVSIDFDPIYTPDIETDILNWDYKKYSEENNYIPDFIWASPPCNTYSPLAYPLKERNTKNAKPKSKRAKIGTAILYKTLEIINYFLNKNPDLKFAIENPRGMMRKDTKMIRLPFRNTTTYCSYGDFKYKPTDFWTNYPIKLKGVGEGEKCKNTISVVNLKSIEERYSIPTSLIKTIIMQAYKPIANVE